MAEAPENRLEIAVKAIQSRIANRRNADVVIKIRDGKIVEMSNTDITRFQS